MSLDFASEDNWRVLLIGNYGFLKDFPETPMTSSCYAKVSWHLHAVLVLILPFAVHAGVAETCKEEETSGWRGGDELYWYLEKNVPGSQNHLITAFQTLQLELMFTSHSITFVLNYKLISLATLSIKYKFTFNVFTTAIQYRCSMLVANSDNFIFILQWHLGSFFNHNWWMELHSNELTEH